MNYREYSNYITNNSFVSKISDKHDLYFLQKSVQSYLNNVPNSKQKKALGEIVMNIEWISEEDVFKVIRSKLLYEFSNEFYFLKIKNKNDQSSSNHYIRRLVKSGIRSNNEVINYNGIEKIPMGSNIVIVDDFIGTGDTIIDFIEEYLKDYSFAVVFHTISVEGLKRLESYQAEGKIAIIGALHNIVENYKSIITDSYVQNFINKVSMTNQNTEFQFGYKQQGLLVTFDGLCPNNDLDLIWSDDIKFNGYSWLPLFGRKISFQRLRFVKQDILKNHNRMFKSLFDEYSNREIEMNQLKICLCIEVGIEDIIEVKETCGYDTIREVEVDMEYLINTTILKKNHDSNYVSDIDIKSGLDNLINHVIIKEKRRLDYMKNKNNKDTIRMYRP